jgi:hypothetical protein
MRKTRSNRKTNLRVRKNPNHNQSRMKRTPPRQEEAKPSKQDKQVEKQDQKRGQEQSREQAKPEGQEHPEMQGERNRQGQEHPEMEGNRERPSGKGGHIPDDKFRAQFGRGHHFNARTVIVQGQPRFQYGGYNFELVDAWPADWAYADDCYLDYIDGEYFLFNLLHPGVRVAVFVVM